MNNLWPKHSVGGSSGRETIVGVMFQDPDGRIYFWAFLSGLHLSTSHTSCGNYLRSAGFADNDDITQDLSSRAMPRASRQAYILTRSVRICLVSGYAVVKREIGFLDVLGSHAHIWARIGVHRTLSFDSSSLMATF